MTTLLQALATSRAIAIRLIAAALLILSASRDAAATYITIAAPTPTLSPGQSEVITISLVSTQSFNLQSFDYVFSLDPSRFVLTSQTFGSFSYATGTTITRAYNYGSEDAILAGTGAAITPGQTVTLATFTVMAQATAPAGVGQFNLLPSFDTGNGTIVTQVNGGAIALSPAPTTGFDPGVDATITVINAVPEPSSIALCGIAGVVGLALARPRRAGPSMSASS